MIDNQVTQHISEASDKSFSDHKGMVLVIVLWILLILTVIAWTYARQTQMELKMTSFQTDSVRAYYLARAGVARAMVYLREDKLKDFAVLGKKALVEVDDKDEGYLYDAPVEEWGYNPEAYGIDPSSRHSVRKGYGELGRGKIEVEVEDMSGRLNINRTAPEILDHLLQILGVDEDYAQALGAAIIDYIDEDDQPTMIDEKDIPGWEFGDAANEDYYYNPRQSPEDIDINGPDILMKNGPLSAVEELLLVPGMTDLIYYGEDANGNRELDDNEDDGDETPPFDNEDGVLQIGLKDYVTVQAGLSSEKAGKTNLNTVSYEVLQATLWGEEENGDQAGKIADKIIQYRDGSDRILGTDDDKRFRTIPHSDENDEGLDKVGIDPSDADRVASLFGVASDYFRIKSTGIVNNVRKTLKVTVVRTFKEEMELGEGSESRLSRDREEKEQVQMLIINFEEEG